ncbi:MAG: hypothetical protein V2A75_11990 [Pseudomonadota bacterium]
MKVYSLVLCILGALLLSGCVGKVDYTPPIKQNGISNQKIIDKSRELVWNSAVPELGKQFFVINNLDKSSGLINISYTGDPESYIDCGRLTSYVKNGAGERTYDFPASKEHMFYEMMTGGQLFHIQRNMSLEGRMNLIFEEISPNQTRVTANTRYIVAKKVTSLTIGNGISNTSVASISFNSSASASFPQTGSVVECVSTGKLEREILSLLK